MTQLNTLEEYVVDVDRKKLSTIKQGFIALNKDRYSRTLSALSERQQQFIALLPLLFHVNHPMLPGYTGGQTPSGIAHYIPSKNCIRTAKNVTKSFHYQRNLLDKIDAIDALFYMGSLSTIAQNEASDLDVWVCYNPQLTPAQREELTSKCNALASWALASAHLEVNFFLMDAQKFKQGQKSSLTEESSGSAQHFLLLDEFYRTAVWLAGKLPLWWCIPVEHEKNYQNYADLLLGKRFLREADFIDFGGIAEIPTNEFVGAGIWQLYKGIVSPYKSVLKLMLLEAYSTPAFNEPLALDFKRKMYAACAVDATYNLDDVDAYILVYERIANYLQHHQQTERLELLRRCFYFKVGKSLARKPKSQHKSWQRILLEKMVAAWGWDFAYLSQLDSRDQWKAPVVIVERNLLEQELTRGYKLLVEQSRLNHNEVAISSQELLVLGRKLHAAFEVKAGKIDWINPSISDDLSEAALYCVRREDNPIMLWAAYSSIEKTTTLTMSSPVPVKRTRYFIELIFWCYANGLLVSGTKFNIKSKTFTLLPAQSKQLILTIQQWLPLPLPKLEHEVFLQPAETTSMLLLLNIGQEPQADLQKKGLQMLSSQRDAFGYSGLKESLVVSADLVMRNSWGEIVCRHFAQDALISCLLHYLRSFPLSKRISIPELSIRCFSLGQGNSIAQRVLDLWRAIVACFYSGTHVRTTRFLFEVADEYFIVQFIQQQPYILRFPSYAKLLEKLAHPQQEFSPIVVDNYALLDKPLKLFCNFVRASGIYLFYQVDATIIHLSLVDEHGAIFSKSLPLYSVTTVLRPLCRFVRRILERQRLANHVLLDRKTMLANIEDIKIFEVMGDASLKNAYLEIRSVGQDISQVKFIDICAMAEPNEFDELTFTLRCNDKEFSELEYGEQLYNVLATFIVSCRARGETYPCYITDVDLSQCRELIAPQSGLQLIHYLRIKNDIEVKLNAALTSL